MNENLSTQLEQMVNKAARSLAAAKYSIDAGDYDFASSRAYYAAFYAIQARWRYCCLQSTFYQVCYIPKGIQQDDREIVS